MLTRFFTAPAVAAWTIASVLPGGSCGPTTADVFSQTPAASLDVKPLAAQLSRGAQIYYPGTEAFTNSTVRWSNLSPPTPNVVIAPGTEKDVSQIVCGSLFFSFRQTDSDRMKVKFASERDIPILAYNGHHGTLTR